MPKDQKPKETTKTQTKAQPSKKVEKKVEKKAEKVAPKEDKKVEKKVEQKVEKKVEKKADKKVEKKDVKPTSAPKDTQKKAPVSKTAASTKDKKSTQKKVRKQRPPSVRSTIRALMRKDPKMREELAKGTKGLPKARAHAKRLKLMRKNRFIKFVVDCHKLYKDHIIKPRNLEKYFQSHIKVDGKTHNFGRKIRTKLDSHRVVVLARPPFQKRYLKYLTKRFLKKSLMRDHVRIVSHGQNGYRLGYFRISMDDAENNSE